MNFPRILLVWAFAAAFSAPDEGQWLPQQFLDKDWDSLKARGLVLSKDEFWHPTEGGVLSATVQIGGCTASFVSEEGLVVTNHHCGFGAVQQASTVERNYVDQGFVATSREAEIPSPSMVVFVLNRIEDVTDKIHAAQAKAATDLERFHAVEAEIERLVAEGEKSEPDSKCHIASFLNGRRYHLYFRTRLQDVRLVYAPPRSVGEFGGEDDNWIWPRHTGDFCFFRAYVGRDGKPAPYSKDNVPYRPKHRLKVAKQGVKEGDLVMVMGYPGRTERYLGSVAVRSRLEQTFPRRHRVLTEVIRILEEAGKGDPRMRLALSAQVKSLANVEKNALGMVTGLKRNDVLGRKLGEEEAFAAWVAADPERKSRYGTVLADLATLDRAEAARADGDEVLSALLRHCQLVATLTQGAYLAAEKAKPVEARESGYGPREEASFLSRLGRTGLTTALPIVEAKILAVLLAEALALPEAQRLQGVTAVAAEGLDGAKLAEMLLGTTAMKDAAARKELFADAEKVRASDDPLVRLARGLAEDLRDQRSRSRTIAGRRLVVGNLWIEAQEKWRGATFYPDANSTLRVSAATVKGYRQRDGLVATPRTTLAGILEKETGVEPFASPKPLLDAARRKDHGRFADPELGDVPVCFLSDADTTGGNSGSPIINGRGELVGLNFDRVFENVVGDYGWNADRSRNIGVDIRYVLWNLEKVLPSPALLAELGF